VWDTKYRPLKFGDVLGQSGTVQLLKARLSKGTALDVSYIFAGGHGQGKTTLARIHARAMLCQALDKADPEPCNECDNCQDVLNGRPGAYVEQDAASGGTIDNIRAIVEDLPFALFNAPKRVYVFDEAHRMSRDAQDVLLKPLEEKKMVGVFCTTEPEKIRGPIRSRCEEYAIRKITREDVLERMNKILDAEGVEHEDDAVLTVIDYSGGHVRDVVNRLEMVAQMGRVSLDNVREYLHLSVVSTYYEVLLALSEPKRALDLIESLCERVSPDDVAAGLAEAAMNAFRLRHGMFADFVYVDKSLGRRLYDVYGDGVVQLAEHFLRQRYASKVALVCDILRLTRGVPATEVPAPIVVVPVAAAVPAPAPAPAPVPVSAPAPVSAPVATPAPATPVAKSPLGAKSMLRPDAVGNRGVDPEAHTDVDDRGVPAKMPRGHTTQTTVFNFTGGNGTDEQQILSPEQWRREFEASCRLLG
jgi:DNA polymerase III subunit gamma/tau